MVHYFIGDWWSHYVVVLDGGCCIRWGQGTGGLVVLDGGRGLVVPLCCCIRWGPGTGGPTMLLYSMGSRGLVVHYVVVLDGEQGSGGPTMLLY